TTLFRSFKVRIEFILRKIRHKFQNTFSSYCCYTCSCCCYEICLDILKTIIVIDMWSNFLNNSNIVYIKESLEYFDKGYHTIENVLKLSYSFYRVLKPVLKKKRIRVKCFEDLQKWKKK